MDEHDRIFTDGVSVGDMLLEIDGVSVDSLSIEGAKQAIFGAFGSISDMMLRQASTGVVYRLRVKRHIPIRLWHAWNAAYQSPHRPFSAASSSSSRVEMLGGMSHLEGYTQSQPQTPRSSMVDDRQMPPGHLEEWSVGVGSPVASPHKELPLNDAEVGDVMTPRGRIVRARSAGGGVPMPLSTLTSRYTQGEHHESQQAVQHPDAQFHALLHAGQQQQQHSMMSGHATSEQQQMLHASQPHSPGGHTRLPRLSLPETPKALLRSERVTSPAVTPGEFSPTWYAFREDWPASSPRLEAKHALYTSVQAAMHYARTSGDLTTHKMLDEVERLVSSPCPACPVCV
jgi:hypothetical protein